MSKAYIRAVRENLPKAIHVFDHFHVVKLYNDKLSAFRRELFRELTDEHERQILKGPRWLLLEESREFGTTTVTRWNAWPRFSNSTRR